MQVMPLSELHLGPTIQITVPSGRVTSETFPSLQEWVDSGSKAELYRPGSMVKLPAEGLRVSDLPPPPPSLPALATSFHYELEKSVQGDGPPPAPTVLPAVRCLYDQTFCHVVEAGIPGQQTMRRVYSPTMSSGGSMVKAAPDGTL